MKIAKFEQNDLQSLGELQPPDWDSILPYMNYYINSSFCFPIKIEIDNQLVGIGNKIYHQDTVWLTHIIVHPNFRKKGIGKQITQALIDSTDSEKYKTFYLIATALGANVYASLGFENESIYSVFLKDGHSNFEPNKNIEPFNEKYREQILQLDKIATAEDRHLFLSSYIADALVYIDGNKLTGFYIPTLKDGLIIAENSETGIELMKFRLNEHHAATIPEENKKAIEFLEQNDFILYKNLKRMRLGIKREWKPAQLFNRTGGQ